MVLAAIRRVFAGRRDAGRAHGFLGLTPAAAFYVLFFIVPLGLLIAYSFFEADPFAYTVHAAFTAANYAAAVNTGLYRDLICAQCSWA